MGAESALSAFSLSPKGDIARFHRESAERENPSLPAVSGGAPQIQKTRPRAVAEGGVRRGRGVEPLRYACDRIALAEEPVFRFGGTVRHDD
jgi:hypothetical protein